MYVPEDLDFLESGVLETQNLFNSKGISLTDHSLIFCKFLIENKSQEKFRFFRNFKNIDYNLFCRDLINIDWKIIETENNFENKVKIFNNNIINLFDKHAPLQIIKKINKYNPWITNKIKQMCKSKKKRI